MALLDHFRPPLSSRRHWHSLHNAWSTYLSDDLNQSLPDGYFAEPNAQFGIEIDVATFSERIPLNSSSHPQRTEWVPRSPTATLPFQPTTDVVEVQIFSTQEGPTLVGAIELVSPANKDRPGHRDRHKPSLYISSRTYCLIGLKFSASCDRSCLFIHAAPTTVEKVTSEVASVKL